MPNVTVPRLWPNSTVVCIASGPSLTSDDVSLVRDKAKTIVVNSSYQMAPWADCLYAADARWWKSHHGAPEFHGLKYALEANAAKWPGVTVLKYGGERGLSSDPTSLKSGRNSGYQAIGLAVHFGASRIVLLGYDMQRGPKGEEHWHANHQEHRRSDYPNFLRFFDGLVEPLKARGIQIVNCTRRTALTCFDRQPLHAVFSRQEVAA